MKGFSFRRFAAIIKKEMIQIRRDKISLRLPIAMPVMMMLLFGYIVNTEVDHISVAVMDYSQTAISREYLSKFSSSGYFDLLPVTNEDEITALIDSAKVKAGIIIPPGFAADLKNGKTAAAEFLLDGSDSTVAGTALSNAMLISQSYAAERLQAVIGTAITQPVDLHTRVLYNPNLEITKFTIPGLVGLVLQNITVMLTAFAMVRERERGTIEQLMITPVQSGELILGKLIPYIAIGYVGFLFALGICRFWFGVRILGSTALLLWLGALFVVCSLAIGMLISTVARTQLQAMMAMIVIILPSILLSGFMFPIEAMPQWIRPITYAIPLTYFLRIDRGIILKAAGWQTLAPDALALLLFLTVILTAAIVKFKKNLD